MTSDDFILSQRKAVAQMNPLNSTSSLKVLVGSSLVEVPVHGEQRDRSILSTQSQALAAGREGGRVAEVLHQFH